MSVHIHWTEPQTEVLRKPDGDERWCFRCRKRTQFEYIVDAPIELSYYGPTQRIECSACKTWDGDCFPGTQREWED
jgi:hypothetical protein